MRRTLAACVIAVAVAACSGGSSSDDSARLCNPAVRKCRAGDVGDVSVLSPRMYELFGATHKEAVCLAAIAPVGPSGFSAAQLRARKKCVRSQKRARELDRGMTEYMREHMGDLFTPTSN